MNSLALAMIIALGLFTISCGDSTTEPSVNEAQVLVDYLEANGDFINTAAPAMIKASDVNTMMLTTPDKIYIIDIRSAEDFGKGHIDGAHNVAVADLLTHVQGINATSFEKIVIACYSGQTASFGGSLLRLMGYNNVVVLKWGMSSWSKDLDKWSSNIGNTKAAQFEKTANAKPVKGALPALSTGKSDGAAILEARVNAILAEGYNPAKISNGDLFNDLTKYHICNYWPEDQYLDPGHIPGAYQYTPKVGFKVAQDLKTLPTDKPVVVYCYTGQTSSFMAAYLRVLGYDAKSLLYGANGMIYDQINGVTGFTAWTDDEAHEYELVK